MTEFEPDLDLFRSGGFELTLDGKYAGHLATEVRHFRNVCMPWVKVPWIWIVVVWADGTKPNPTEDYPPWIYVRELSAGHIDWADGSDKNRHRDYQARRLPADEAAAARERLGIVLSDF